MSLARRRKRTGADRTPQYLAHEALGRAVAVLCIGNPLAREAVHAGYTRALRAHVIGGAARGSATAKDELEAAAVALAAAHGIVPEPKPMRRRRR